MQFKNPFVKIKNNEKLLSLKNEYGYLGYAFLIPAVLMLAIYIALGHKPFGDLSVLTLDLNAQYVYFYEALREFLCGDASLLYSFSRSLGGEFMGIYAYYIASPLSYLVILFPKELMLYALLTIIVVKIGLCGLFFGFYLHKQTKSPNKLNIILFSVMYALSAYAITYQNNIMWLDGLFLLPILTYSIERLIKDKKYLLFIGTLALMMMSHYYIGYMLCWYTFFCFFFTYFKEGDKAIINPSKEKFHFVKSLFRIGASSVLGIGMSAFIVGVAYYSLQFGKNEFSQPNWDLFARFDLFDLFPKLLPGSYDTVMHEGLPLLYCGILTLFMLPIYVMAKHVKSREKIFFGGFTLLYILIMVINPTDLVMHGFQAPNCLNYRYSFIVIFLLLIMAYKGFCEIQEHSPKKIFATGAAIISLLLIAQKMTFPNFVLSDNGDNKFGFVYNKLPFLWVVVFTIIAVFAIGAILCYLLKSENKKVISRVLLLVVCIELLINGVITFASMRYNIGWGTYSSYYDYFQKLTPVVEQVQNMDKTFYRSEKTTHRCTNDNMALNIKGLSNSTSTLNQKVIDLLEYLGFYADAHWTQYYGSTAITDALLGIKYIYSNTQNDWNKESITQNAFMDMYYDKVAEDENYYAYKNPYALGIAFGVDSALKNLETDLQYDYTNEEGLKNPFEAQNLLLNTLLGNDEENAIEFFSSITLRKGKEITTTSSLSINVNSGMEYSIPSNFNTNTVSPDEDALTFTFTVEKTGPLYLMLPSGYERSVHLYINDEHYSEVSNYSRIVFLGYRESGEEMTINFRFPEGKFFFYAHTDYLYTLDMDEFEHAIEKLMQTNLVTTEESTDDHIFGSLTTYESNQMIMTTIPFDAGWKVYVDGKQVETYSVYGNSLMAFDIENAGQHEIEFKYMPDIYITTGIISAVSTLIFIGLIVFECVRNKKRANAIENVATEENNSEEISITNDVIDETQQAEGEN